MQTALPLKRLTATSYATAVEKGWWDGSPRSFAGLTELMKSELAEALEEYRAHRPVTEMYFEHKAKGIVSYGEYFAALSLSPATAESEYKPCGIPAELADVVIRVCDYAGHAGIDLEEAVSAITDEMVPSFPTDDFEHALAVASLHISRAFEYSLKGWPD